MDSLLLHIPSKVFFGVGSLQKIGDTLGDNSKRTIVITEGILRKEGTLDLLLTALNRKGIDPVVYEEVEVNSTSSAADQAVKLIRAGKVGTVIGMGGVRALSIAKCSAAAAPRKAPIDDYLSGFPLEDLAPGTYIPYIELPTTCRNPFLLTQSALMIDARNRSPVLLNTKCFPKTVLIDPSLSTSLTAQYTFTTLLDTFLLALEGFLSQSSRFLSDVCFLRSATMALDLCQGRWRDTESHSAREAASEAGTLAALGLSQVPPGMGSYLSHSISGACEVPQSSVASVLLPHIADWAEDQVPQRYNQFLEYLLSQAPLSEDTKNEIKTDGLGDLLREYMSGASVPARLIDLTIKPKQLTGVIQNLFNMDCLKDMPREIRKEDIDQLLEKAL